ncbi:putative fimbrial-like protein [Klebsiella pneumoniae]|uniref:Putative fimbrial-like protein n=1 Tax=Klebsiella pneumoniae TaxID=573 RepID=A0A378F5U0_KLEPN|nr:putative fimbrial-like protein [Klebsiella pneumoniae]
MLALSDAADTAKGVGIEVFSSPDGSTEGTQLTFDKQSKTRFRKPTKTVILHLTLLPI